MLVQVIFAIGSPLSDYQLAYECTAWRKCFPTCVLYSDPHFLLCIQKPRFRKAFVNPMVQMSNRFIESLAIIGVKEF